MQDFAPYSTYIALQLKPGRPASARNVQEVSDKIQNLLGTSQGGAPAFAKVVRAPISESRTSPAPAIHTSGFVLRERRENPWDLIGNKKDVRYHLCLVSGSRNLLLVHVSDSSARAIVERAIRSHVGTTGWCSCLPLNPFVAPEIIETAFLDQAMYKALWMAGGHRTTAVKPSSKLLNGIDLEYALDSLGDQSYMASAARAQQAGGRSYGVTPRRGVVWRGPNPGFNEYRDEAAVVIDKLWSTQQALNSQARQPTVIPVLMRPQSTWAGVVDAYDFELADPETLESKADRKLIERLRSGYSITFVGKTIDNKFDLEVSTLANPAATLQLEVEPKFDLTSTSVVFEIVQPKAVPQQFLAFTDALVSHPRIWRCWYDSGHSIVDAGLTVVQMRDASFNDWRWMQFNPPTPAPTIVQIDQEKPDTWGDIITAPNEKSLFSWCVKNLSNPAVQPMGLVGGLALPSLGQGSTWLYCDDGSREVADFVYIHQGDPAKAGDDSIICLIHVKGANGTGKRQVVPSPYEVLSAQAIKNIRDLESKRLLARISGRVSANGAGKIWDAPWAQNVQPAGTPAQFLAALQAIGANARYVVVLVQPHAQKSRYQTPAGVVNQNVGACQLRTLLHGVRSAASGANVELYVIGDDS